MNDICKKCTEFKDNCKGMEKFYSGCIYFKKEVNKMLREKIIKDLREDKTIELLTELGKINIDSIDEDLIMLIEVLETEFNINTEIQNLIGGQYLVYLK